MKRAVNDEQDLLETPSKRRRHDGVEASGEVIWTARHRAALLPPYQDLIGYQAYRRSNFTRKGMRNWAQILTVPTADTPGTTLLLHFDNKRYLIGSLAEGTQRACVQMGARLLKVQECFLTGRTEWKNTGGLIGMILTLADAAHSSRESSLEQAVGWAKGRAKRLGLETGSEGWEELMDDAKKAVPEARLSVFGGPNLNFGMATARRFVFRKGMPVDLHEVEDKRAGDAPGDRGESADGNAADQDEWAPYWADENIKVWPMSIWPNPTQAAVAVAGSTFNGNGKVSPRKRSIDEVYLDDRAKTTARNGTLQPADSELSQTDKDALTAKAVVGEMFNSSWRLDTLYETPLSQVNLPATIFVRNPETKKVEKYSGPLPGSGRELPDPDMTVLVRKPWPGALVESLPPTQPRKESMCYIIKNHLQRGKFFPNKAMELKVEKGQKWSQLQNGETVLNADGEPITPDMVLGEPKPGGGMAFLDLPDATYIDALVARPEWKEKSVMDGVGVLIWNCGEGVMRDERVQQFMSELAGLKHVVASPETCANTITLDSATAAMVRLGQVDSTRYGMPQHKNEIAKGAAMALPENCEPAQRGLVIQTEPKLELQIEQVVPPLDLAEVASEMSAIVLEEAKDAQRSISDLANDPAIQAWQASIPNPDADVTTLGTGSALPSKYRNVSSTLVRVPGWGNIMLDAGENTLGQLKRVFPQDELKQILRDLRILVISHMHADHHLGTVGVLKAWYSEVHNLEPLPPPAASTPVQDLLAQGQPKRLAVISEPAMQHWLTEYASVEDFGLSRITPLVISPSRPKHPSKLNWFISPLALSNYPDPSAAMEANLIPPDLIGLADAQAVLVQHCHGARAVSLTLPSGFKVSYSGDCRPSSDFVRIGKGSTVCIHEATFDDELAGDAQAKNHSTTSEALSVAEGMGSKACVLTHFSQRYQKMPVLEHTGGAKDTDDSREMEDLSDAAALVEFDDDGNLVEYTGDGTMDALDPEQADTTDVAYTFPDQPSADKPSQATPMASYTPFSESTTKLKTTHPPTGMLPSVDPVRFRLSSDMKVAVAFDYMRVRLGDLWQMEKFTPALVTLFAEEERKAEEKSKAANQASEALKTAKKGKGVQKEANRKASKESIKD